MKGRPFCHHALGTWLALSRNRYHDLSKLLDEEDITNIIEEILSYGFSSTLRKKLFVESADGMSYYNDDSKDYRY